MPLYNSLQEAKDFNTAIQIANAKAQEWHLGYLRYEVTRKLNPKDYADLWQRCLKGERFDDMIDDLIRKVQAKERNNET